MNTLQLKFNSTHYYINLIYTSEAPTPINKFRLVTCIPRTGESFVLKLAMIIFVLSVRTPGLWVTLTSSKLQSPVNFEKFHSVMLESTEAETNTLLHQIKDFCN